LACVVIKGTFNHFTTDFAPHCRLLTGSFDKTVKVWSQDGQVMHRLDGLG